MNSGRIQVLAALALLGAGCLFAQETWSLQEREAAYTRAITQRADKMVTSLGIADPALATHVRDVIIRQYRDLRAIHDTRDARVQAAKLKAGDAPDAAQAEIKTTLEKARAELATLHADYLAKLSTDLSPEQVDRVKDGMTYGVVQVTYNAYLKMLPDLSARQKEQIMAWLVEAREIAMDEGTSDEKHRVFGKYKGKINNYLSTAGYDLKKAEQNLRTSEASKK